MLYDGSKWDLINKDIAINNLIDTNEILVEEKLDEWEVNGNQYYPEAMRKFNHYLNKKEDDNVLNAIKEEIKERNSKHGIEEELETIENG